MNDIIVFVGPTLPQQTTQSILNANYHPPAGQGDVFRATQQRPWGIVIIDGYFEHRPAIWHKEILWALSQGIHVFGAGSMGAIRAAELHAFGMIGTGKVFQYYRDQLISDDDEVAVVHFSDQQFSHPTDAMVNIRATLSAAAKQQIITPPTHEALLQMAKQMFYGDRRLSAVITQAHQQGLPPTELNQLNDWLPSGYVNQKHLDAIAILKVAARQVREHPQPFKPTFHFNHTEAWQAFIDQALPPPQPPPIDKEMQLLLDELCLQGPEVLHRIASKAVALAFSAQTSDKLNDAEIQATSDQWRKEQHLLESAQVLQWMHQRDLDQPTYSQLLHTETIARKHIAQQVRQPEVLAHLLPALLLDPQYPSLYERYIKKSQWLNATPNAVESLANNNIETQALLDTYFHQVFKHPPPQDIETYANLIGLTDATTLYTLLRQDHAFRCAIAAKQPEPSFF